MKKLFTVHIQNWRINGKFYITENSTGKKVGIFFGAARKRMVDYLRNNANAMDAFDFVLEIPDEPNPIPEFVERYEIFHTDDGFEFDVRAVLTEKGAMRKSMEMGGGRVVRITPFGPMNF